MNSKLLKSLAIVVIFFFSWTFAGISSFAYAVDNLKDPAPPSQPLHTPKPEEKFQKSIEDIGQILDDQSADIGTKKRKIKAQKEEIESLDGEIRKQFAETEKKLRDAGFPNEILQRHHKFVKHYEDNLNELKANLDDIEKAGKGLAAEVEIEKAKKHLQRVKAPKKHTPLDPNKLPHRTPKVEKKEPRLKKEDFEKDFVKPQKAERQRKPILVASNGSLKELLSPNDEQRTMNYEPNTPNLMIAQASGAPTPADLEQTIEVQFTPEIIAKAQELGNNPVKIYNWVRNNIEFVPTYGSIQGAHLTLLTKQGNAFDTASLLIALLRASNIPARYVYGTIEIPIDKVMNWVGDFTDATAALDFIASGGIPVTGIISGGKVTKARMEHIWVEAWVDYIPSRSARHKSGEGDTWIPLDASYKQYAYTQGIDIRTAVPFDAEVFINQIKSTAIIDTTNNSVTGVDALYIQQQVQDYQTRVQNYIAQNYPNATTEDILGKKEIIKQDFPYLLGTLPYNLILVGAKCAVMPDNLRHKITFNVIRDIFESNIGGPINITKSLPEIAGKKITLSYSPATLQDQTVINSYLPKPHPDGSPIQPSELPTSLPAYLINLKPELRIDGEVVATGSIVGMGVQETFDMTFYEPGKPSDVVSNLITSGGYYAVAIDTGRISQEQLLTIKAKLESTKTKLKANDLMNLTKEDILGDFLYIAALFYYSKLDVANHIQSIAMRVISSRLPSEAIFSIDLNVNMMFGIPRAVSAAGFSMDVDRNISTVAALDGGNNKRAQFMYSSGTASSVLEHLVPELLFSTKENPVEAISAVKAIKIANDQHIPLFSINMTNINTVLPLLQVDNDVLTDIQNAVYVGNIVTISRTNISFNGWTGCGYIITDPNTGAGAYRISGGLSGGKVIVFGYGDCEKPYLERVINNFVLTNETIPGLLAPPGLGILLGAPRQVAALLGTITLLNWIRIGFAGAIMEGVAFTAVETGILAGATALMTFMFVGLAYEIGVLIGSLISAAILPCEQIQ